jgi:ribonuclease BN (tRNA processing enzyme)
MTGPRIAGHLAAWLTLLACLTGIASAALAAGTATPAGSLALTVLGSGGPGATGRAGAAYLVSVDGTPRILVDAGPGAFVRVGESGLSLADVDLVLLTHLHVDHAGGLAGLFKARAVAEVDEAHFRVWGPAGSGEHPAGAYFPSTSQFVELLFGKRGAFAYLADFAAPLTIDAHDLPVGTTAARAPQVVLDADGIVIKAIAGHHADAPAVIYRIEHAGRSITFSGDIDAAGLAALRTLAKGTDLLVFNSVVRDPPGSRAVLYDYHTPPQAIGELARNAGARHLLLSHISPAVDGHRDEVIESIRKSYAGPVDVASDGLTVEP